MTQAHIIYSGIVQGVGFRFAVQKYALSLNLTGWVKNCSNGSVEIYVNGPKTDIEKLSQKIEQHFGDNINDKSIQYGSPLNEFNNFQITY